MGSRSVATRSAAWLIASATAGLLVATSHAQSIPLYTIQRAGLSGANYTGNTGVEVSRLAFMNGMGHLAGTTDRSPGISGGRGTDAWFHDAAANASMQIGLTGTGYISSTGFASSSVLAMNAAGQTVGLTGRYTGVAANDGVAAWVFRPQTGVTTRLGLTGPGFVGSGGYEFAAIGQQNDAGFVSGSTRRVLGVNTSNGQSAWLYKPETASTLAVGLGGTGRTGSQNYQFSAAEMLTAGGQVAGYSERITGLSTSNGRNTWIFDPISSSTTQTGFFGPAYTGTAGYQFSAHRFATPSGQIAGTSRRIRAATANTSNGDDAWIYDPAPGQTRQIGLLGPAYTGSTGFANSAVDAQNRAGTVVGYSNTITGINTVSGTDSWLYNPSVSTTLRTGLTGAGYETPSGLRGSINNFLSDSGHIAGQSFRYSSTGSALGRAVWQFDPIAGITRRFGLLGPEFTGSAGYQESYNSSQDQLGRVAGFSRRVKGVDTNNGIKSFAYDPTSNLTIQTGLAETVHFDTTNFHLSESQLQSGSGQIAGRTRRFNGATTTPATDNWNTWVFDFARGTTVQTGLTMPAHSDINARQLSINGLQNASGVLVGISTRFTPGTTADSGQDAWYYNPASGLTAAITQSVAKTVRSSDGYAYSSVDLLTASGIALGEYRQFPSDTGNGTRQFYMFRPDFGFVDLTATLGNQFTSGGWSSLSGLLQTNTLDQFAGLATRIGQADGSQSVFLLVPSPGSGLAALAPMLLACRRWRRR